MQHLSLGQLLGAAAVQPGWSQIQGLWQRPEMQRLMIIGIVLFVISQVVQVFSWWGCSRFLGRKETSTLNNAFNVWVGMLAFVVVGVFAIGFVAYFVAQVRQPWQVLSTWGGVALLSTVILFLIPMKIYAIGFWRAFGILVLGAIVQSIVMSSVTYAAGAVLLTTQDRAALQSLEQFQNAQIEEWKMQMDRMAGKNPSTEITRLLDEATATPRPSIWKREDIVRKLHKRLDRQRRSLSPGDYEANAVFRQQMDRYLRLLQEVKTERAMSPVTQATYFPAEKRTSLVA